ncbi:MAG: ferredoxin [Halovenus sp.]
MPTIDYNGEQVECEAGRNLRDVLLEHDLSPHTGVTNILNCNGHGTCGTCAIRLTEGPVRADEQATRLALATHDEMDTVRLACQYTVTEDVVIEQP